MPSPFSTFVNSTDIEELIEVEYIDTFCETFNRGPSLRSLVGGIRPGPVGSPVLRLPRYNELDLSGIGAQSEGDFFNEIQLTTTEESITASVFGAQLPITRQAAGDASPRGVPANMLAELLGTVQARLESDLFAVAATSNVQYDATAGAFTSQALRAALATWRATLPLGKPLVVISLDAMAELIESLASSGATMAPNADQMLATVPGYAFDVFGASVFTSPHLLVTTGNPSGFIVDSARRDRGLVQAVWQDPRIEIMPQPNAYSDIVVCSARYGQAIGNNSSTRGSVTEILLRS